MKGLLKWVHQLATSKAEDSLVSPGSVSFRAPRRDVQWTRAEVDTLSPGPGTLGGHPAGPGESPPVGLDTYQPLHRQPCVHLSPCWWETLGPRSWAGAPEGQLAPDAETPGAPWITWTTLLLPGWTSGTPGLPGASAQPALTYVRRRLYNPVTGVSSSGGCRHRESPCVHEALAGSRKEVRGPCGPHSLHTGQSVCTHEGSPDLSAHTSEGTVELAEGAAHARQGQGTPRKDRGVWMGCSPGDSPGPLTQ